VWCCPCGVGQATCSEGGLDIASNSGLEGDRVTDLCSTARLGGHMCPREVWLHVQSVSRDDGRLDPAQDRDLSGEETYVFRMPTDLGYTWSWHFMWKTSSVLMSVESGPRAVLGSETTVL